MDIIKTIPKPKENDSHKSNSNERCVTRSSSEPIILCGKPFSFRTSSQPSETNKSQYEGGVCKKNNQTILRTQSLSEPIISFNMGSFKITCQRPGKRRSKSVDDIFESAQNHSRESIELENVDTSRTDDIPDAAGKSSNNKTSGWGDTQTLTTSQDVENNPVSSGNDSEPMLNTQMVWEDILSQPHKGKEIPQEQESPDILSQPNKGKEIPQEQESPDILSQPNKGKEIPQEQESPDSSNKNSVEIIQDSQHKTADKSSSVPIPPCELVESQCLGGTDEEKAEQSDVHKSPKRIEDFEPLSDSDKEKLLMFLAFHSFELVDFNKDEIWEQISVREDFNGKPGNFYKANFFSSLVHCTENYNVPQYFCKHLKEKYGDKHRKEKSGESYDSISHETPPLSLKVREDLFSSQKVSKKRSVTDSSPKESTSSQKKVCRDRKRLDSATVRSDAGEIIGKPLRKPSCLAGLLGSSGTKDDNGIVKQCTKPNIPSELKKKRKLSDCSKSDDEPIRSCSNTTGNRRSNKRRLNSESDSSDSSRNRIVTRPKKGTKKTSKLIIDDTIPGPSEESLDNSELSEFNPFETLKSRYFRNDKPIPGRSTNRTSKILSTTSDSESSDEDISFNQVKPSQVNSKQKEPSVQDFLSQSKLRSSCSVQTPSSSTCRPTSSRIPYLSYEKVNMIKYLLKNASWLHTIKGNVFWKEMEGANAVHGRTWQSLKNHFFKSLVFELDQYNLDPKFEKKLKLAARKS
ncbi:uncharacterized protein LOC103505001 isoform X3 [Diaphorina citri]|uniref:Uncharacterized protein LOC103505001 isoform X3 n=1 Tax=Diaphorina citri TaxID=121845 RepID=A0A3Q0IIZ5_DIACI|nr:uncharacterized protein LOC103505001 isoform X3 [Diaphorina citri]